MEYLTGEKPFTKRRLKGPSIINVSPFKVIRGKQGDPKKDGKGKEVFGVNLKVVASRF